MMIMGVYIKGMEMPKSGTYEVSIDTTNGKDKTIMSMFVRGAGGLICCGVYELVPVPSHGRLIDADAICADIDEKRPGRSYEDAWALTVMDAAPTIIPADGKDTDVHTREEGEA